MDRLILAQRDMERGDVAGAQKLLLDLIKEGSDHPASDRGVQTRVALAEVYEGLGQYDDAGEVLAPYDVHALEAFAPHLRGLLLLAFGSRAHWQNDFPRAVTLLNRACEILEPTGDAANIARAYHCLGRTYWALDEQALAREHFEIAIEWGRRARKDRALAITYMNLGVVARLEGDLDEAGMCHRRALRLLSHTADEVSRARLQNNLGVMLLYQGNFYEAANSSHRALEHLAEYGSDALVGQVYNNLAMIAIYTGDGQSRKPYPAGARDHARGYIALEVERRRSDAARSPGSRARANELLPLRGALRALSSKKDETQLCSRSPGVAVRAQHTLSLPTHATRATWRAR